MVYVLVAGKEHESLMTLDNDSDTESVATSESNTPANTSKTFLMRTNTDEKQEERTVEFSRSNSQDNLYSPNEAEQFNGIVVTAFVLSFNINFFVTCSIF